MKRYTAFLGLFFIIFSSVYSQTTEIECIVKGRMGIYMVLEPAHYDEALLPAAGTKVILHIYVKEGLPAGKEPGYYEIGEMEFIEAMADLKRIRLKLIAEVEKARVTHGIPDLYLKMGEKVKIVWGS